MKILNTQQIRKADQYTIQHEPIASIDLMERASSVFVKWFKKKFSKKHPVKIFCGIGNNGGDGLVAARLLLESGYNVISYIVRYSENTSEDFAINYERLTGTEEATIEDIHATESFPSLNKDDIIIDAMWGSGLSRPIEGFSADLIEYLNKQHCIRVAIDMPSGVYADALSESIKFKADFTLTFELPKLSFLFSENQDFVGEWTTKSIGLHKTFIEKAETKNHYLTKSLIKPLLNPRKKFGHKGTYGHCLLITGSYGKMGAATLANKAALKAGAGLTTAYVPSCGYEIMQTAVPEVMTITDPEHDFITTIPELSAYQSIGIGPGIGTEQHTANALHELIEKATTPLVLDADALNMLSQNRDWLDRLPKKSILTPHPKEFARLFGETANSFERLDLLRSSAEKYGIHIILKTAHTAIACPDGNVYFNSTGNPGMATGGSGDVLTGFLTGLLSQGYDALKTCLIGVFIHGWAGDVAAKKKSIPSMTASDLIEYVHIPFKKLLN